jgi:hypothetical protein
LKYELRIQKGEERRARRGRSKGKIKKGQVVRGKNQEVTSKMGPKLFWDTNYRMKGEI